MKEAKLILLGTALGIVLTSSVWYLHCNRSAVLCTASVETERAEICCRTAFELQKKLNNHEASK